MLTAISLSTTSVTLSSTTTSDVQNEGTTQAYRDRTDHDRTSFAPHDRDNGYDLRMLLCVVIGLSCLVLALILGVCWWRRKKFRFNATFSVMYKRYFHSSLSDVVNWNGTFRRTTNNDSVNAETAADTDSVPRVCTNDIATQADTSLHARCHENSNLVKKKSVENLRKLTYSSSPRTDALPSKVKDIAPETKVFSIQDPYQYRPTQSDMPLESSSTVDYATLDDLILTPRLQGGDHPSCSYCAYLISVKNISDTNATCRHESDSLYSVVKYRADVNALFHLDSQSLDIMNSNHHKNDVQMYNDNLCEYAVKDNQTLGSTESSSDRNRTIRSTYCNQNYHATQHTTSSNFHEHSPVYMNVKDIQLRLANEIDARESKDINMHALKMAISKRNVELDCEEVCRGVYANQITLHLDVTSPNDSNDTDV